MKSIDILHQSIKQLMTYILFLNAIHWMLGNLQTGFLIHSKEIVNDQLTRVWFVIACIANIYQLYLYINLCCLNTLKESILKRLMLLIISALFNSAFGICVHLALKQINWSKNIQITLSLINFHNLVPIVVAGLSFFLLIVPKVLNHSSSF
mmetsp:Transcript_8568/g.12627  ORF Transcript_8568/g.12627 Transcript_8568/m.12627 type:complete len:151 (+) Transcript_8568:22-474(+)